MWKLLMPLLALSLPLFFNNCGAMQSEKEESVEGLSSLSQPYQAKVQYFDDIQIIGKSMVGDDWNYKFDIVVVDADNEDSMIDVEIDITNEEGQRICARSFHTVNRLSNHIVIDNCLSSEDWNHLLVQLKASPSGGELKLVRVHRFDLEG